MRVLFITHNFPPETNAPAVRTYENCRRWVQMGHQVTVITGPPNFPAGVVHPGYRNGLLGREEVDGIRVLRTWMYLAANRGFGRRILNYLSFMLTAIFAAFFAPRCDLVIGTSPQFFVGIAAWLIAALRRRPFIFEVRDLWPESIVALGALEGGPVIGALDAMARFLYRRAARIVVVTDAFREILEGYGVDPAKIAVVTNGVDLKLFRPGERQNNIRRELGLNGQFLVSYTGTLGMAHGLQTALDAAEMLRDRSDIRFLLIGNGADREALAEELRTRDLPNVLLLEPQPRHRMPEFLAATDACMVLLRKAELFKTVLPSKMFEAMGAARPIILGVEGEAASIVRGGDCGVVIEPENAAQLADAVRRLKEDPEQCARLGQNGRALAAYDYDRNALAARYAAILAGVLEPASRRVTLPVPAGESGVRRVTLPVRANRSGVRRASLHVRSGEAPIEKPARPARELAGTAERRP